MAAPIWPGGPPAQKDKVDLNHTVRPVVVPADPATVTAIIPDVIEPVINLTFVDRMYGRRPRVDKDGIQRRSMSGVSRGRESYFEQQIAITQQEIDDIVARVMAWED